MGPALGGQGWPSRAVAMAPAEPGVLMRMPEMEPPYSAAM
jgi:hypothetical protein